MSDSFTFIATDIIIANIETENFQILTFLTRVPINNSALGHEEMLAHKDKQHEQQTATQQEPTAIPQPQNPQQQQSQQQQQQQQQQVRNDDDVNLSFCGCGFLGIYHVGVASCFHEYAPQLSMHKISGSSAGALVAVAHICGNLQLAYATTDILRVAIDARARALGPFHPSFDITSTIREALERGLPEDVHLKASGKLHVSLTRVYDGENVIISEFGSKEDVISVLVCSCFIPFWSGLVAPKYKGVTYVDGGFSNNLLILDNKTVTVSPFAGEADICPEDDTLNLLQINLSNTSFSLSPNNLYRLSHALLPPPPEVLSDLCEQGFADGIRFLQRMKLISCNKCLEIRSSLLVTTNGEDMEEAFTNEVNESLNSTSSFNENHHIRLEQQEQKTIEINGSERRDSVVSTTSHQQQHSSSGRKISSRISHHVWNEDSCDECDLIRRKALIDALPKQFSDRIRDACDTVNKSLSNWIYSHRPIKYLSYLAAPYYLPVDISLALVIKCWQRLPFIRSEMINCVQYIMEFLIGIVKRMHARSTSTLLMGSISDWDDDAIDYENEGIRLQKSSSSCFGNAINNTIITTKTTVESSISVKTNDRVCVSKFRISRCSSTNQLHSLEDTFDSIVDVTSNQEARIFAYYFRDAKNRLQVTEIFDYQRAADSQAISNSNQQDYQEQQSHQSNQSLSICDVNQTPTS